MLTQKTKIHEVTSTEGDHGDLLSVENGKRSNIIIIYGKN